MGAKGRPHALPVKEYAAGGTNIRGRTKGVRAAGPKKTSQRSLDELSEGEGEGKVGDTVLTGHGDVFF